MAKATEFGLIFETTKARESVARAKLAEELGFASYWVPEDYIFPGAFSLCAAIAGQTRKIKIGIGVLNPYTRHPVLTAMEFAALDQLSEGRGILGIGAGVKLWIEHNLGIPYTRSVTAMRETMEIVRALFRGEELAHAGRAFNASGLRLSADTVRSEIPIHLGASGDRSLQLAGEAADGVMIMTVASVHDAVQQVRAGAARAGRNLENFAMGALVNVAMSEDERKARDAARAFVAWLAWLFARQSNLPIYAEMGLNRAQIQRLTESPEPIADVIADGTVDRFAVVGSPSRCCEKLAGILDAGITHPVLHIWEDPAGEPRDVSEKLLSHFL